MTKRLTPATGPLLTPVATGKADPASIRTLRCRTVAQGRLHQVNYIRNLPPQQVMEDEPGGLLGEAVAPNASEALLAALGSCLVVGIHADAVAQRIPIRSLELELEADINTTAVWGAGDLDPKSIGPKSIGPKSIGPKSIGFEAVRVSVRLDADAPRATLLALVRRATLWSPVANTLHNPVHLDVTLAPAVDS